MKKKSQPTEIIYGYHAVNESLKAGRRRIQRVLIAEPAESGRKQGLFALAERCNVPVKVLKPEKFRSLVKAEGHNGVAAVAGVYKVINLDQALAAKKGQVPFWAVLDQVTDPRNLGAIVRSAYCAGVEAIVVARNRSAPPSPAAVKASAGALEHMVLVQVTNLARTLQRLKKEGFWAVALDADGQVAVFEADFRIPLVLVIGAEGRGVRPLVKKHCDFSVAIPQQGQIGSLNASAAATVAFYEVMRQRRYGTCGKTIKEDY